MAFDVVIAGGGFGGLYGWTVGLLFRRASAELGQLGHPPRLGGEGDAGSKGQGA